MQELAQPGLTFLGVVVTAVVSWMVSRRSARVQYEQQRQQNELGLVDRYRAEIDRIDDKIKTQDESINKLTKQNVDRTAEVSKLREEMSRIRQDHIAETARLELTLATFHAYIGRVLDWINARFEEGELETDHVPPQPPPEYAD